MTIAEEFKAIGYEEGLRLGMQQAIQVGMQRGQHDGRAAALLNLIQLKFGPPDEPVAERIRRADIEDLDRWIARILTADSVDALLTEAP